LKQINTNQNPPFGSFGGQKKQKQILVLTKADKQFKGNKNGCSSKNSHLVYI
jgi:hypothetical protein